MKIGCRRCGGEFDEGFYAQHRVTPEHTKFVTPKQARFGGPTVFCQRCGQTYAPGDYDMHAYETLHIMSTKWGRTTMARRAAILHLERRDAYILAGIRAGRSYGDLSQELNISRQRVHQIAKQLGVQSTAAKGKRSSGTMMRACFFDGKSYTDWTAHAALASHAAAVEHFSSQVAHVKRTVNAGGAGPGAGHTPSS